MDAKESTTVSELKRMVQGITKRSPEDMKLFKDDQVLWKLVDKVCDLVWLILM